MDAIASISATRMKCVMSPLVASLSLLSAPLLAQEEQTNGVATTPIVVTADKEAEEKARKEARRYVRTLNVAHFEQQVARWIDPICPKVIGVDAKIAARVDKAIRKAATAAKAPLAKAGCETNVFVAFTIGGEGLAQKIASGKRGVMYSVAMPDRGKILQGNMPIRWWYSTDVATADGTAMMQDAATPGAALGFEGRPILQRYTSGLIKAPVIVGLKAATIIIDVERAEGKSLDAVADYAAMIALARIDIDAKPEKSILSLFDAGSDVDGMTERDTAFLAAVYRIELDRWGQTQRGQIVRALTKHALGK